MTDLKRDPKSVNADGSRATPLPDGVRVRPAITHTDSRGTVTEMFDPRWGWHPDPLLYVYTYTLRPRMVKGWGMHLEHEDRYFLLQGEMEIVMWDDREGSATRGEVTSIVMSEHHRGLVSIPTGVWHANVNLGTTDVLVVNFPTVAYDHDRPDKFRKDLDTDEIPYRFPPGFTGF